MLPNFPKHFVPIQRMIIFIDFKFIFSSRVLNITSSIEDLGGFQWELVGTLLLGWVIVYLIVWKGLHSSGKVRFLTWITFDWILVDIFNRKWRHSSGKVRFFSLMTFDGIVEIFNHKWRSGWKNLFFLTYMRHLCEKVSFFQYSKLKSLNWKGKILNQNDMTSEENRN